MKPLYAVQRAVSKIDFCRIETFFYIYPTLQKKTFNSLLCLKKGKRFNKTIRFWRKSEINDILISSFSDWLTTFGKFSILLSVVLMSNFDDFLIQDRDTDIKGGTP